MLYRFKLTNREDKYVTIDEESYKFLTEDPVIKGFNVLENLREHSTSGGAVYQKWFKAPGSSKQLYQETIYLHKAIAEKFMQKSSDKHNYVVHINGNRLDCRMENLSWCTRSELNRYCKYDSDSGYRGVRKEKNKYRAVIYINQKAIHLGMYDTADEAALAYNEAALRYKVVQKDVNKVKKAAIEGEKVIKAEKVKKKTDA